MNTAKRESGRGYCEKVGEAAITVVPLGAELSTPEFWLGPYEQKVVNWHAREVFMSKARNV